MKKFSLLLIGASLALSSLFAQAPAIEWQKTIGGNSVDNLATIRLTPDGGYILGGISYSDSSGYKNENKWGGEYDYWVVKLDSSRNIQWQRDFGGTSCFAKLRSIELTTDGGYVVGGETNCGTSGNKTEANKGEVDYWIIKLNASGQTEWKRDIGGNESEFLSSAQQTADGGYIVAGRSWSGVSGDKTEYSYGLDYWVVKLDIAGNIQWQNTISAEQTDDLESIQQTTDGGYILGGSSSSKISYDKTQANSLYDVDYWVVKLNAAGNIEWEKTLNNHNYSSYYNYDYIKVVRQTADGGYIFGGTTLRYVNDPCGATAILGLG